MTPRFPDNRQRSIYWIVVGFILLLLAWSCIGEIDIVVTAQGKIIPDGYTKVVQAGTAGTLTRMLVKEGDLVKTGANLAELDPSIQEAELSATRDKIEQLNSELARLEAERSNTVPTYDKQLSIGKRATQEALREYRVASYSQRLLEANANVESKSSALEAGGSLLEGLKARHKIAKEKEESARKYVDIAIPRFQYLQWKDDLIVIERDISNQRHINQKLQYEYEEARQRRDIITAETKAGILTDINVHEAALTQLKSELVKAEKRLSDNVIKAPVDGYVQKIFLSTIGAALAANDPVFIIVPKGIPLIVEAYLLSEEKGFVKQGQRVDVKLDAYPFQKYGKLKATLIWASPDSEELNLPGQSKDKNAKLVYRVKIKLLEQPKKFDLVPGMTLKADILTDSRKIIHFFLFPVIESTEEALRVR